MINISPTSQITKIYLVTNCYGDPNKVYIGKTTNISRKTDHKRKFGKDIIFTYIDEIKSLDSKDWKPLECFWIEYFRQLGFDLQNGNKGGGGPSFLSQETKDRMSFNRKGKTKSIETKDKISKSKQGSKHSKYTKDKISLINSKTILQYDLNGNFIKIWESAKIAGNILNIHKDSISQVCRGKTNSAGCFLWRFKNNPIIAEYNKPVNKNSKPIIQYDLEGNFIKEWPSITEASNLLKINLVCISMVCSNKLKTAGNFIWKYKIPK